MPDDEHGEKISRREFLKRLAAGGAGLMLGASGLFGCAEAATAASTGVQEARYYRKLGNNRVQCTLCPWKCVTSPGQRGICRVRENRGGTYYTLVHGRASALHVDPIEKKPLFHFKPGTHALSVGTAGCNLRCKDCQNWQLSQRTPEQLKAEGAWYDASPQTLVSKARQNNIPIIAYTYNEPIVFYEYMYDTAKLGQSRGVKSVMISAGNINAEPMKALAPHLDAIKIDLKGFTDDFYRNYTSGSLEPVKQTIKRVVALGKWLEIVYLVVPTLNDDLDEIRRMAEWLLRVGGEDLPLHFSRFYPAYKLKNLPPTPLDTLRECRYTAMQAGLNYVYVGNVPGTDIASTHCPQCGETVIKRSGFRVLANNIKSNGHCKFCGHKIAGVW